MVRQAALAETQDKTRRIWRRLKCQTLIISQILNFWKLTRKRIKNSLRRSRLMNSKKMKATMNLKLRMIKIRKRLLQKESKMKIWCRTMENKRGKSKK